MALALDLAKVTERPDGVLKFRDLVERRLVGYSGRTMEMGRR